MSELAALDTNILVYALFESAEHHAPARALLDTAVDVNAGLCLLPQNLVEFYSAVTNPRRVSDPKTSAEALEAMADILALPGIEILPVPTDVVARVVELLRRRPVTGAKVHDVHLVAGLLGNAVTQIYTFNTDDFTPFEELSVFEPAAAP